MSFRLKLSLVAILAPPKYAHLIGQRKEDQMEVRRVFSATGLDPIRGTFHLVLQYPNIHVVEKTAKKLHVATFHVPFLRGYGQEKKILVFEAGRRNSSGVGKFSFSLDDVVDVPKLIDYDITVGKSPPANFTFIINPHHLPNAADIAEEKTASLKKNTSLTSMTSQSTSPLALTTQKSTPSQSGSVPTGLATPTTPTSPSSADQFKITAPPAGTKGMSYVQIDFSSHSEQPVAPKPASQPAASSAYVELDLTKTAALAQMYNAGGQSDKGSGRVIGRHQQGATSAGVSRTSSSHGITRKSDQDGSENVLSEINELVTLMSDSSVEPQGRTTRSASTREPPQGTAYVNVDFSSIKADASKTAQGQQYVNLDFDSMQEVKRQNSMPSVPVTKAQPGSQSYVNIDFSAGAGSKPTQPYKNLELTSADRPRSSSSTNLSPQTSSSNVAAGSSVAMRMSRTSISEDPKAGRPTSYVNVEFAAQAQNPHKYVNIDSQALSAAAQHQPQMVVALFDNQAEAKFELSFRQGDRMLLVEETFKGSSEWWLCELAGKRGAVPSNYVKKV